MYLIFVVLYSGVSLSLLGGRKLVQKAVVWALIAICKQDHKLPIMASSHWRAVKLDFKILLFVFEQLRFQYRGQENFVKHTNGARNEPIFWFST